MKALQMPELTEAQQIELSEVYRSTKEVRIRTRAQIVLLACEQDLTAPRIAAIVRVDDETVRRWLKRYLNEGIEGLRDRHKSGAPTKVTKLYKEQVLETVRRRPRSLGQSYSMWTLQRLADYMAEHTCIIVSSETIRRLLANDEIVFSQPQHTISSPDPDYVLKKKAIEVVRDHIKIGEVFYYADEFNVSLLPTLRALWSPKGQQVMIQTPGQQTTYYGIGAVNYYTGETVVQFQRHKRRQEIAQLLEALVEKHPTEMIYVAWDNANTHEDEEVDAVVQAAEGRLVLLYLPTYSPWLNPIEMLWRHFRREVTHCELFESMQALLIAAQDCFERFNQRPRIILSVIGSHAAKVL
jgi:putative transposase